MLSSRSESLENNAGDIEKDLEDISITEISIKQLIENELTSAKRFCCPKTMIEIEGIKVKTLVDTGSEITCIQEAFFLENQKSFAACPVLPVVGFTVVGATGGRPVKIKKQIF